MLLDTNILIYGATGDYPALDEILDRSDLATARITQIETLGYHRLTPADRRWLEVAFSRMSILALDDAVAAQSIALRQAGRMGLADAIIASTALCHGLALVTRNVNDFEQVVGLELINPLGGTS